MKIPLHYHDRRMEGETPLRQAQLVELHLLEVFMKLCETHGFRYWIHSGTLIGALRHGGFIPWDDDLDVYLLKHDYPAFLNAARQELPDDVFLDLPEDEEAFRGENTLTRLRDNYSMALAPHVKRYLINDHHGISIDIFLLEECGKPGAYSRWVLHQYVSRLGYYRRSCYNQMTAANLLRKWVLGASVLVFRGLWRLSQLFGLRKGYLSQTNFYSAWKKWVPRDWLVRDGEPPRKALFEGLNVPIPYEAEKFLELEYGDWRKLPPVEKRHGYFHIILPTTPCFHKAAMEWNLGASKAEESKP